MNLIWKHVATLAVFTFANSLATTQASADEWGQWRGPNWKSISLETSLPSSLDPEKNLAWKVAMPGSAGSSPVVWGKDVFVTSVENKKLVLLCVTDGKIRWKKQLPGVDKKSRDAANSASPSPSTDGKHVWAMMGNGHLSCYTIDGEKIWTKDLQKEYGKFFIQFGMSTTPILDNGNLYLALMHGKMRNTKETSVGQIISLDAKTGKQNWLHLRKTDGIAENKHSYTSPTIYREGKLELLITHGGDYVIAHSLKDGSEVWRRGGFNRREDNYNPYLRLVASPVCTDGLVITPTAKRGPVFAVRADQKGDLSDDDNALAWNAERRTPDVATPVVYQGLVYLAGESGEMSCLDIKSGKTLYRERLMKSNHRSTPVAADGKIYLLGRRGNMIVLKAGRELKVLSKNDIGEEITSSPAISNGKIYVRTFDALYAFSKK